MPSHISYRKSPAEYPNWSRTYETAPRRKSMPATPLFSRRNRSKRSVSPSRRGKPPTPSGIYANERSDSRIAKRPSCQKPWRGMVARKFGLPRPALSIETFAGRSTAPPPAALISSSFSSNGLSAASLSCSVSPLPFAMMHSPFKGGMRRRARSCGSAGVKELRVANQALIEPCESEPASDETHDKRPKQGQRHIGDRISDSEGHGGHGALRLVEHTAERGVRTARAGQCTGQNRGVPVTEHVAAEQHRQQQRE